jgi:hypothetical protein
VASIEPTDMESSTAERRTVPLELRPVLTEGYWTSAPLAVLPSLPTIQVAPGTPEALLLVQGMAGNCHLVAAMVSCLWDNQLPAVARRSTMLFKENQATAITVNRFLKVCERSLLPWSRQDLVAENYQVIVTAYEILRYGYLAGTSDIPNFNFVSASPTGADVLGGLQTLTGSPTSIFSPATLKDLDHLLTSRRTKDGFAPTLLWSRGLSTNTAFRAHVYSVLDFDGTGIVIRDSRETPQRTEGWLPVEYNSKGFSPTNTNKNDLGLSAISKQVLLDLLTPRSQGSDQLAWFLGGTT